MVSCNRFILSDLSNLNCTRLIVTPVLVCTHYLMYSGPYSICFYICVLSSTGEFVSALDKVVYINNRRFLPITHPLRKASKKFPSGKAEHRSPPEELTQEEVILNSLAYENAKNQTQASGFATATGSKGCPCLMLLPDHDRTNQAFPDTMHLVKNVTCEMVQLISGYKDTDTDFLIKMWQLSNNINHTATFILKSSPCEHLSHFPEIIPLFSSCSL